MAGAAGHARAYASVRLVPHGPAVRVPHTRTCVAGTATLATPYGCSRTVCQLAVPGGVPPPAHREAATSVAG